MKDLQSHAKEMAHGSDVEVRILSGSDGEQEMEWQEAGGSKIREAAVGAQVLSDGVAWMRLGKGRALKRHGRVTVSGTWGLIWWKVRETGSWRCLLHLNAERVAVPSREWWEDEHPGYVINETWSSFMWRCSSPPHLLCPRIQLSVTLPAGPKKSFAHSSVIWITSITAFPSLWE